MTIHQMYPDSNQSLVFDHGWSLPVAVAPNPVAGNALAEKFNSIMEWDQFDADYAAGMNLDSGKFDFPVTGFYYDADKMTLVKEVDND